MAHLFLILFLLGFVLTQVVNHVDLPYLDTIGSAVMAIAAISYVIALAVGWMRTRTRNQKP